MIIDSFFYKSKAKINLFLHILSKESNCFHKLQSITYFPDIYDELVFSLKRSDDVNSIKAKGCFADCLPNLKSNSIIKVISYFQENFNIKEKIHVDLQKKLPIGGGIGGGSSNTAITIVAMNDLFNLNLSFLELINIAKKFGSDVPVCLHQKPCVFEGFGEITTPINLVELPMLLINPKQSLITADVFKNFVDSADKNYSTPISNIKELEFHDLKDLISFLKTTKNDLLSASLSLNKNIANILENLDNTNALLSRMSGSGSTCFAIYKDNQSILLAKEKMEELYPNYWISISKI